MVGGVLSCLVLRNQNVVAWGLPTFITASRDYDCITASRDYDCITACYDYISVSHHWITAHTIS